MAARDNWNSRVLLCTSRAQVLETKYVSHYAFVMYGKAGRPVGGGKPAEGEGGEGGGNRGGGGKGTRTDHTTNLQ